MPQTLPDRPDLDWLKKAAKERLSALRAADPGARLHQAQHDVARDYGFKSWRALKAHVDATSLDGRIIAAAVNGHADDLERLLVEHPRKLEITGGAWVRPLLHLAADNGHLACVAVLLRLGADVDRRDRGDRATALHWAAQAGHLDVVKRLLAAGADINGLGDEHEMGVIGWATCFQHVRADVADFLLAQGARPTIFAAVALGRIDLARRVLDIDPASASARMSRFEQRRTALHFAVIRNRPEMVELLLERGADATIKDDKGKTPLSYASAQSDARIAVRLIAAGADPRDIGANPFLSVVPILNVRSVPASLAYYVERLGFEKEWDWGTPPTFACVRRDDVRLFLCQGGQGSSGTWISIFVHDVDALHQEYRRRGATIREAPTDYPWGVREMNVEDLDGHRLRLGSDASGAAQDGSPGQAV